MTHLHDDPPGWNGKSWPTRWFRDRDHRILYLEWLGKKLGCLAPEDWYQVRTKDFEDNKGANLLYRHYPSKVEAVRELFPNYDWKFWLFDPAPDGCWNDSANQRAYMDWLGQELGYTKPEDWYGVRKVHFEKNNGIGFLRPFRNSPREALESIYPDYEWLPWKFRLRPERKKPSIGWHDSHTTAFVAYRPYSRPY